VAQLTEVVVWSHLLGRSRIINWCVMCYWGYAFQYLPILSISAYPRLQ